MVYHTLNLVRIKRNDFRYRSFLVPKISTTCGPNLTVPQLFVWFSADVFIDIDAAVPVPRFAVPVCCTWFDFVTHLDRDCCFFTKIVISPTSRIPCKAPETHCRKPDKMTGSVLWPVWRSLTLLSWTCSFFCACTSRPPFLLASAFTTTIQSCFDVCLLIQKS